MSKILRAMECYEVTVKFTHRGEEKRRTFRTWARSYGQAVELIGIKIGEDYEGGVRDAVVLNVCVSEDD